MSIESRARAVDLATRRRLVASRRAQGFLTVRIPLADVARFLPPCPACGAVVGQPCQHKAYGGPIVTVHPERVPHLTEQVELVLGAVCAGLPIGDLRDVEVRRRMRRQLRDLP